MSEGNRSFCWRDKIGLYFGFGRIHSHVKPKRSKTYISKAMCVTTSPITCELVNVGLKVKEGLYIGPGNNGRLTTGRIPLMGKGKGNDS